MFRLVKRLESKTPSRVKIERATYLIWPSPKSTRTVGCRLARIYSVRLEWSDGKVQEDTVEFFRSGAVGTASGVSRHLVFA